MKPKRYTRQVLKIIFNTRGIDTRIKSVFINNDNSTINQLCKNHDGPDGRGVSGVNVAQRCKSVSQLSFWREARRLQQSVSQPMNEAHDRVSEMNGTINPSLATNIAVTHLIFVLHEVLFSYLKFGSLRWLLLAIKLHL